MNPTESNWSATAPLAPSADLPLVVQLLRYLIVGGVAFVVDFAALALLTELAHLHYLQSAGLAFLLGMAVNYLISVRWVFKVRAIQNARVEFLLFALVGVVGLGINQLVLWALSEGLHLYYLQSKLLTTGVVLGWNFGARKLLLFSRTQLFSPVKPVIREEMIQL